MRISVVLTSEQTSTNDGISRLESLLISMAGSLAADRSLDSRSLTMFAVHTTSETDRLVQHSLDSSSSMIVAVPTTCATDSTSLVQRCLDSSCSMKFAVTRVVQ